MVITIAADGMSTFWADGANTARKKLAFGIPAGQYIANAFGASPAGGSNHDGDIGLVRLYNRALKDSEVLGIFQDTFVDTKDLLHDWQFRGTGPNGVLVDSLVQNRANGQLIGGGMWRTKDVAVDALRQDYVSFDGEGDSVQIPPLKLSPNVTFEVVYRHSSTKDWARLLDFRQAEPASEPSWKRNGFALLRNDVKSGNFVYYTTVAHDQAGQPRYARLSNEQFETVLDR